LSVILFFSDFRGGLNTMNSVLPTFNERRFAQSQVNKLWRSLFIVLRSCCSQEQLNFRYVSSAKWKVDEFFMALFISLIYMRKRRGPNIDPCGTPQVISRFSECVFLYLTLCCLLDRYDLNHWFEIPRTP